MPRSPRFTADNVPEVPDWGLRREVLDGRLVLAPPSTRRHDRIVNNLASRFWDVVPAGVQVRGGMAIRLPDGDGPVPDLAVISHPFRHDLAVVPSGGVLTVVEVVAADGRNLDRVWKRQRYAEAGIPCYWRVEVDPWPGYQGPLPLVVVRLREAGSWREILAPAGQVHALPVACARTPAGGVETVQVRVDPLGLTVRQATDW